ncbi:DNA-methyltransferase [Leptospira vanthielii]|uniref:Methyltransferase n=1 Tax=Leptospira vanthielii serovar Holland str. Waz Holland = ATCC 700522 TaxID=1218591 RepID=N1VV12_9LEPT|nr:site-specific DNA-methyltransferase [Leptospira vanthielii]EMY67774.1 DNA methylase family protein [Leptospira vanthielii serovar Holland str. Waz Holland = ATCC 700522]
MNSELLNILKTLPFTEVSKGINLVTGDSYSTLSKLPDNLFQTCVTSPPYWGLRDYGISNQIGSEFDLSEYINNLVKVFREVKRTLRKDGTLWLNIGDSYTSGNRTWRDSDKKNAGRAMSYRPPTPEGLKPKDLIGVPWKIAFALQEDGWYLRSDIIWNKPNCQPESVKDRPTRSHEYLFLLTKAERYLYNYKSIQEATITNQGQKNKRSVWSINTEGFPGSHFAVFPRELVRTCILAGSDENSLVLDPFLGSGTVGEICKTYQRNFLGIELNPDYVNLSIDRISKIDDFSLFKTGS